jgi:hypothetical protein
MLVMLASNGGAKGFEPKFPRKIDDAFETTLFACSAGKTGSVARGTGGSNPLCSSGESSANLTSADRYFILCLPGIRPRAGRSSQGFP